MLKHKLIFIYLHLSMTRRLNFELVQKLTYIAYSVIADTIISTKLTSVNKQTLPVQSITSIMHLKNYPYC